MNKCTLKALISPVEPVTAGCGGGVGSPKTWHKCWRQGNVTLVWWEREVSSIIVWWEWDDSASACWFNTRKTIWMNIKIAFLHVCACLRFRWVQEWCFCCLTTVSWAEVSSCTVWLQWSLCCSVSLTSCFISLMSHLWCPNSSSKQSVFRCSTHLSSTLTVAQSSIVCMYCAAGRPAVITPQNYQWFRTFMEICRHCYLLAVSSGFRVSLMSEIIVCVCLLLCLWFNSASSLPPAVTPHSHRKGVNSPH